MTKRQLCGGRQQAGQQQYPDPVRRGRATHRRDEAVRPCIPGGSLDKLQQQREADGGHAGENTR